MKDTAPEILQKQREILLQKSKEERFLIGADLIDTGRIIMSSNLRKNNPGISDIDLKIELFRRCYSNDFKPDELERIIQSMINFYHRYGK